MKIRLCLSLDTFDTRCLVFVHERPLVIVSCFENEFNFDICCRSEQNIDLPTDPHSIEQSTVVSDAELPVVCCE